ncbi:hypothetical protein Hbal_2206 [Hirschia baltica ATCC 49814]|uniref:Uncharacterized protein n=1 Tax=Hirschia baltica (strain ATCC 49814 / DSM 5838 / IFAM 1418) TaxID=582402 RepID=C6XM54_HIRBI|nr:hypothetical protein Hbal_2206 [Hirschia baltica ATCC 49814]
MQGRLLCAAVSAQNVHCHEFTDKKYAVWRNLWLIFCKFQFWPEACDEVFTLEIILSVTILLNAG